MPGKRYEYQSKDAGDGQGRIEHRIDQKTGKERTRYVPIVGTDADKLALEVIKAVGSRAGTYASAVAGLADVVITQGSQLAADLTSNQTIAHIAQRLGDAEPGVLAVLASAAGLGVEESFRHYRRSQKIASQLEAQGSTDPLMGKVHARTVATRTKWGVRAARVVIDVAGGGIGAIPGAIATATSLAADFAEGKQAVNQRIDANNDLNRKGQTRH